jgi:hypothetical protein
MDGQFNYIDRQQSKAGGNSEKSQKVHCANWKEEVHLRKELEALRRQENVTLKRIISDQKAVANKFRRRVYRTIELINSHEEVKVGMKRIRNTKNAVHQNSQPKLIAPGLPSMQANNGKASSLVPNMREKPNNTAKRPVTASELRVRAWGQKIQTISSKLQRAQSAPAMRPNTHSVEQKYITKLDISKICKTVDRNMYMFVKLKEIDLRRDDEMTRQKQAVTNFIEKIKQLS